MTPRSGGSDRDQVLLHCSPRDDGVNYCHSLLAPCCIGCRLGGRHAEIAICTASRSSTFGYKCKSSTRAETAKVSPSIRRFPVVKLRQLRKVWASSYRRTTNDELWATYNRNQEWRKRQQIERQHKRRITHWPLLGVIPAAPSSVEHAL